MADETLRLAATVEDQATGPLRRIQEQLNNFKPTPGMRAMREEMDALRKNVQSVAGSAGVGGGMWGGILGAGIAGGALAGVTAAISSLDAYARKVLEVRHIAKETGLGASDIKIFEKVGERFQVPKDQMDAGLKNWAATIDEVQRRRGAFYNELQHNDPHLTEQLVNEKDTKKALGLYLSFLSKIKDAQAQKQWADMPGLQGFERLFINGAEEFKKKWAEVSRVVGSGKGAIDEAKAWAESIDHLNDSLDKITKKNGARVLGWLADFADRFNTMIGQDIDDLDRLGSALDRIDERYKKSVAGIRQQDVGNFGGKGATIGESLTNPAIASRSMQLAEMQKRLAILDESIGRKESEPTLDGSSRSDTEGRSKRETLIAEMKRLADEIQKLREQSESSSDATASKMSFGGGGGLGGLIQNASISSGSLPGSGGGGGSAFGMRGRYRFAGGGGGDTGSRASRDKIDVGTGGSSAGNLTKLIDQVSREAGIDPRLMEGIRAGESGHGRNYDVKDDRIESSWGPFQLNRRRGLGVQFEHDTGLDIRDKSTIAAQARWVAKYIKRGGSLSAWMGYHGPRDVDPRWGDSGYVPEPKADDAPLKTAPKGSPKPATTISRQSDKGPLSGTDWKDQKQLGSLLDPVWAKNWHDTIKDGNDSRLRDALQPGSLLKAARAAGVGGGSSPVKVDTDGTVKVELTAHGLGDNVRAKTAMDGIVSSVKLNKGTAMPTASNRE